jgi:hypothetical protein
MKAKEYVNQVLSREIPAPKYVKLQCEQFMEILEDKNKKYFVDLKRLEMTRQTLKTMIMPRGLRAGDTIYDCSCGYQWLFYTSVLCIVHRSNPQKDAMKWRS